jgi:hypothetical protein
VYPKLSTLELSGMMSSLHDVLCFRLADLAGTNATSDGPGISRLT